MRGNKTMGGVAILLAVLLVGVGYASITARTLNIVGNATVEAKEENFKVSFTATDPAATLETDDDTYEKTDGVTVTSAISSTDALTSTTPYVDKLNASFDVTGMSAEGNEAVIKYTITNESDSINAAINFDSVVLKSNDEINAVTTANVGKYLDVTIFSADEDGTIKTLYTQNSSDTTAFVTLEPQQSADVYVVVDCIKTPVAKDVKANVSAVFTATPMEQD